MVALSSTTSGSNIGTGVLASDRGPALAAAAAAVSWAAVTFLNSEPRYGMSSVLTTRHPYYVRREATPEQKHQTEPRMNKGKQSTSP